MHFHRPKGGRFVFPRPPGRLFGFIQTGAPSFSKGATPRPLPPERSDATLLYNPWHRGPSGPMDAICPSAAQRQAPTGIQPPRRLVFTAIGNTYKAYRDPSLTLRMTVGGGPTILDLDLRSQPLREAATPRPLPPERQRRNPSIQPMAPRAVRPDGCHMPLCRAAAGPYGNTAAPPTGIYCHWQHLLRVPRSFAGAQDDSGWRGSPIPIPILEPRSQPLRGCHQRKNIITDSTTTKSTTAAYII